MTENERTRSIARAKILKALAHPSRIFIVEKIKDKPYCVRELAEMIGIDQSTTSKHLSILKNAGIIADKKEGTTVYYSLRCGCIMDFIGCIENVIRMNMERDYQFLKGV
ncbi:MAG: winged helix-turn-helix transcriptional regulator [Spirochaetales bacterium]|nr:winged helix-turn-helix transcriptional regulator [Spirochaetales bacterium]